MLCHYIEENVYMLKKIAWKIVKFLNRLSVPFPVSISSRIRRAEELRSATDVINSMFLGKSLTWDSRGFWLVTPMVSELELSNYYNKIYWGIRPDSQSWLTTRDIDHFSQIQPFVETLGMRKKKLAVNFGSGHGGCSFLFQAAGFEVWNVDPAEHPLGTFHQSTQIADLPTKVQFIYSSHSLEHVIDPYSTISEMLDGLDEGGFLFVEVPNARRTDELLIRESGVMEPPIHPPHTVYYTSDFFRGLGLKTLILDTFSYSAGPFAVATQSDDAEVIRYLGQKVA